MTKQDKRIKELEERVRQLECAPKYYPVFVPYTPYVAPTYIPVPAYQHPVRPNTPWWGVGIPTITCGAGEMSASNAAPHAAAPMVPTAFRTFTVGAGAIN